MKVYDLIQELTNYDADQEIDVQFETTQDLECPECEHEFKETFTLSNLDISASELRTNNYSTKKIIITVEE
jgi:hypothetical protein